MLLQELWNDGDAQEVEGSLGVVHQFVDMPSEEAEYFDPDTHASVKVSIGTISTAGHATTEKAVRSQLTLTLHVMRPVTTHHQLW
jgi:hypothetical protein